MSARRQERDLRLGTYDPCRSSAQQPQTRKKHEVENAGVPTIKKNINVTHSKEG